MGGGGFEGGEGFTFSGAVVTPPSAARTKPIAFTVICRVLLCWWLRFELSCLIKLRGEGS